MHSRAQRIPEEFLEATYETRKGKRRIVNKPIKANPSRNPTKSNKKLPPVEARHHGNQNDLGVDPDFPMDLDPCLPTVEEVRSSYGNVRIIQSYTKLTCSSYSLWNRARMIICGNGYPKEPATLHVFSVLKGLS
jgi:hypothetical protein